jgi:hypothetical protein
MQGFGNMTPKEMPEGEFGNITAYGPPGFGNRTPQEFPGFGSGNATARAMGPGAMQGSLNGTAHQDTSGADDNRMTGSPQSGNAQQGTTSTQTKEDVIADLISRLQGLLSARL